MTFGCASLLDFGNAGGVVVGQRVVFWGEHWWDQVTLAEKAKVRDFKGWAASRPTSA